MGKRLTPPAPAGDPSAGDPSAGDPSAGDPSAGDPSAGDPSAGGASGLSWAPAPQVDISPAYDLLHSFAGLQAPRRAGPWAAWAGATVGALTVAQQRRMQRFPTAGAYIALIPTLPAPRTLDSFLQGLARMPIADFLRVAVTSGATAPDTPLAADDLRAISADRAAARAFAARYLRLATQQRARLLAIVADPQAAREELAELLATYAHGPFAALEPQLRAERERAGARLQEIAASPSESWPYWITEHGDLRGFAPVVLAPSAFLGNVVSLYYHETRHPLFDGSDYEPFIISVGAQRALGPVPVGRRGVGPLTAVAPLDPAARYAGVYGALADPSRLRLVRLLAERPHYGQELAAKLDLSEASISHHIAALQRAGITSVTRQSHRTYHALRAEALAALLGESQRYLLGAAPSSGEEHEA